jgi:hypothetical protein
MMTALANICPTHLLDRDLQRAWAERDPEIPAKASLAAGQAHPSTSDAPLLSTAPGGVTRLRVLS